MGVLGNLHRVPQLGRYGAKQHGARRHTPNHTSILPPVPRELLVSQGVFRTLPLPFIHCICLRLTILFRDPVHLSSSINIEPRLILSAALTLLTHPISGVRT